jgi:ATP-dependent DNA helicase RecQ
VRSAGDESLFQASRRVRHVQWGEGQVLRAEGDRLVVLFDEVGYKTLSVALAQENALLDAVNP